MVNQGAVSADRMFDSGIYQQLDFAARQGKVDNRQALVRQAKLITTITGTLYDFLEFKVELGASSLDIVYSNARTYTDALIHSTAGFMNQINVRQGSRRRWTGERTTPDELLFRMDLPERLADEG